MEPDAHKASADDALEEWLEQVRLEELPPQPDALELGERRRRAAGIPRVSGVGVGVVPSDMAPAVSHRLGLLSRDAILRILDAPAPALLLLLAHAPLAAPAATRCHHLVIIVVVVVVVVLIIVLIVTLVIVADGDAPPTSTVAPPRRKLLHGINFAGVLRPAGLRAPLGLLVVLAPAAKGGEKIALVDFFTAWRVRQNPEWPNPEMQRALRAHCPGFFPLTLLTTDATLFL